MLRDWSKFWNVLFCSHPREIFDDKNVCFRDFGRFDLTPNFVSWAWEWWHLATSRSYEMSTCDISLGRLKSTCRHLRCRHLARCLTSQMSGQALQYLLATWRRNDESPTDGWWALKKNATPPAALCMLYLEGNKIMPLHCRFSLHVLCVIPLQLLLVYAAAVCCWGFTRRGKFHVEQSMTTINTYPPCHIRIAYTYYT